ncbi:MAG: hypothetical protein NTY74_04545 [Ignavibacteriae bacterium]|nr:hypothetical protein [Ignavibacteriota bacterium]
MKNCNGQTIHPDFDGHLEKPVSKMTVDEKLDYLWMAMEFHYSIRNAVNLGKLKDVDSELYKKALE